MVVTDINLQKRKGRYNIYIDGEFYSGLDAEALVKSGLKVGSDVSKELLEKWVNASETRSAFEKLIDIISRSPRSVRDLKNKLLKIGYNKDCVDKAIEKAQEYGYVDNRQYAKMFVESKNLKSKRELEMLMFQKGIDRQIIKELSVGIDESEECQRAKVLAEKYMRNKEADSKTMANLYAFLARKGFNNEAIQKVLRFYKFDEQIGEEI